jgi:hypothetical protein
VALRPPLSPGLPLSTRLIYRRAKRGSTPGLLRWRNISAVTFWERQRERARVAGHPALRRERTSHGCSRRGERSSSPFCLILSSA